MKFFFLVLFFGFQGLYSQDKVEREFKIKPSAVPVNALDFIKESAGDMRVNWYMEQSARGKSIEAKFRKNGRLHSAEFDTEGNIQDVEVIVKKTEIPDALKKIIDDNIGKEFSRFKIQKIQKQWTGKADDLQMLIKGDNPKARVKTYYEIIINGRKDKHNDEYELLFNEDGRLTRQQKIVESNQQHLIF